MEQCEAKLKVWSAPDGEFRCRLGNVPHKEHQATGLYPHQTIYWQDGDRRQFRGEFVPCDFVNRDQAPCVLPSGHHGNHAS